MGLKARASCLRRQLKRSRRLDSPDFLPPKKLKVERDRLTAHKTVLQAELRKIQREEKKYDSCQRNVEAIQKESKSAQKLKIKELL